MGRDNPAVLSGRIQTSLTWLVFVLLLLVLGTDYSERFYIAFMKHLADSSQVGRWNWWVDNGATLFLLFVVLQMLVVLGWYRLRHSSFDLVTAVRSDGTSTVRSLLLGISVGLVLFLLSFPLLRFYDAGVSLVSPLIEDFYSIRTVVLITLLAVALPITTEIVFRGIVFKALLNHVSVPAALVASSLLFAYVLPLFHPVVIFLLGIANGLLYYRSGRLLGAVLANATFSVCCTVALMWYTLTKG